MDRQNCISRMVIALFSVMLLVNGVGRVEAQQTKDVTVVNTTAQPIPTVVQSLPGVTVVNTTAQPVPTVVQNLPAGPLRPTAASQLVAALAFLTDSSACTGSTLTGVKELSFPLTVPAGKVFILTDFTWNLDATGYQATFPVAVGLAGVTNSSGITSDRIIAISATPNSATGGVIKTETIANGVVALRPSAGVTHLCLFPETFGTHLQAFAFVHGYLAADE